jgi:hypothetical protein
MGLRWTRLFRVPRLPCLRQIKSVAVSVVIMKQMSGMQLPQKLGVDQQET